MFFLLCFHNLINCAQIFATSSPVISLSVYTAAAPAAVCLLYGVFISSISPLFHRLVVVFAVVVVVFVVLLFVVHLISDFSFLLILFDNGRRHWTLRLPRPSLPPFSPPFCPVKVYYLLSALCAPFVVSFCLLILPSFKIKILTLNSVFIDPANCRIQAG